MPESIWVYDLNQNQIGMFDRADTISLEQILQGSEVLSFFIRGDDSKASYVVEDAHIRYKNKIYRISKPEHVRDAAGPAIYIEAEAIYMELLESVLLGVYDIVGKSISNGITQILTGLNWTLGSVESDGGSYSIEWTDVSVLQALRDFATLTSREIEFDTVNKQINFVLAQGVDNGIRFSYGYNLEQIKRTATAPLCTRLYAYGANNLSIDTVSVDGKPYVDNFSWYTGQGITLLNAEAKYLKTQVWVDSTYLSALNLYDAAILRVAALSQPQLSYEMAVADLSAVTSWPADSWAIGDVVHVFDEILDVDVSARVVRLITKPYEPYNNQIELSVLQNTTGTLTSSTQTSRNGLSSSTFQLLVDENANINSITTSQETINSLSLSFAGQGNIVLGFDLAAVASAASGTSTFTFWWGSTQVGPTVKVDYLSNGNVQVGVPISLVGLTGSDNFYVKGQVTTGSGTITAQVAHSRLYVMATGALGGGVSTDNNVNLNDTVTYVYPTITDSVVISQTAAASWPSLTEAVSYSTETVTDSVSASNAPVDISDTITVTESVNIQISGATTTVHPSDTITVSEAVTITIV